MFEVPNRSSPTRATMKTSAPQSRAATAWFAPFPPNHRSNFRQKMVSPGLGNWVEKVVKSTLALPTTAMRGRFAIIFSLKPTRSNSGHRLEVRKAECSQSNRGVSTRAAASTATTEDTGAHRENTEVSIAVPGVPLCPLWLLPFLPCNLIHLASAQGLEYSRVDGHRLAVRTVGLDRL